MWPVALDDDALARLATLLDEGEALPPGLHRQATARDRHRQATARQGAARVLKELTLQPPLACLVHLRPLGPRVSPKPPVPSEVLETAASATGTGGGVVGELLSLLPSPPRALAPVSTPGVTTELYSYQLVRPALPCAGAPASHTDLPLIRRHPPAWPHRQDAVARMLARERIRSTPLPLGARRLGASPYYLLPTRQLHRLVTDADVGALDCVRDAPGASSSSALVQVRSLRVC